MKKFFAELIGTAVLVFMGCGTAMLVGCGYGADEGSGYLIVALAFGLSIVAMAYCIGNISGCHVNPAVSLAVWLSGGMKLVEMFYYMAAQVIGAILGAGALKFVFHFMSKPDMTSPDGALMGFGSNGLPEASTTGDAIIAALLVEAALTFIFVIAILGVTSEKFKHGSFGGLIIGLTLTFVHIFGIAVTGTSVNPARSIGPALMALISGNKGPIGVVWVFIVAPLFGAVIATCVYKFLETQKAKKEESAE